MVAMCAPTGMFSLPASTTACRKFMPKRSGTRIDVHIVTGHNTQSLYGQRASLQNRKSRRNEHCPKKYPPSIAAGTYLVAGSIVSNEEWTAMVNTEVRVTMERVLYVPKHECLNVHHSYHLKLRHRLAPISDCHGYTILHISATNPVVSTWQPTANCSSSISHITSPACSEAMFVLK